MICDHNGFDWSAHTQMAVDLHPGDGLDTNGGPVGVRIRGDEIVRWRVYQQTAYEVLQIMARCTKRGEFLTERAASCLTGVTSIGIEIALTATDIRGLGVKEGQALVDMARELGNMPPECPQLAIAEGYSRDAVTVVHCDQRQTTFYGDTELRDTLAEPGPQIMRLTALFLSSDDVDELHQISPQEAQYLLDYVAPILSG